MLTKLAGLTIGSTASRTVSSSPSTIVSSFRAPTLAGKTFFSLATDLTEVLTAEEVEAEDVVAAAAADELVAPRVDRLAG